MEIGDGMDNGPPDTSARSTLLTTTESVIEMQCDTVLKKPLTDVQSLPSSSLPPDSFQLQTGLVENATFGNSAAVAVLPTTSSQCSPQKNISSTCETMPDIDLLDSSLLHQFSCLGTRDHDDLIEHFYTLMNNQMSKDAARFFLEMSNW